METRTKNMQLPVSAIQQVTPSFVIGIAESNCHDRKQTKVRTAEEVAEMRRQQTFS